VREVDLVYNLALMLLQYVAFVAIMVFDLDSLRRLGDYDVVDYRLEYHRGCTLLERPLKNFLLLLRIISDITDNLLQICIRLSLLRLTLWIYGLLLVVLDP
jgi:hypothetical protein